jgi:hypothetical protein
LKKVERAAAAMMASIGMPLAISQGSSKPAFLPAKQGMLQQTGSRQNREAFLGLLLRQQPHRDVSLAPDGPTNCRNFQSSAIAKKRRKWFLTKQKRRSKGIGE